MYLQCSMIKVQWYVCVSMSVDGKVGWQGHLRGRLYLFTDADTFIYCRD
jgi:hypothetical protein